MSNNIRVTYRPSAILRLSWLAFVVLLSAAIPNEATAAARSNTVAVTLVARVAAVLRLQASSPTATGATAKLSSTGQNIIRLEFTMNGDDPALIKIPIVMRTNVDDFLLTATFDGAAVGYIWMEGSGALGSVLTSRPMPVGPKVTFAVASGLFKNSGVPVGSMLPGTINVALPAGIVPQGQPIPVQITMELLRQ